MTGLVGYASSDEEEEDSIDESRRMQLEFKVRVTHAVHIR